MNTITHDLTLNTDSTETAREPVRSLQIQYAEETHELSILGLRIYRSRSTYPVTTPHSTADDSSTPIPPTAIEPICPPGSRLGWPLCAVIAAVASQLVPLLPIH